MSIVGLPKHSLPKQQNVTVLINKSQEYLWRRCNCISVESDVMKAGWQSEQTLLTLLIHTCLCFLGLLSFIESNFVKLIIVSHPSWFDWTNFVSTKHLRICCQRGTALRLSVQELTINTSVRLCPLKTSPKLFSPPKSSKLYLMMMATRW